ncbi:MAG: radical SAM protein [Halanaerobiales bacterium]|nr:radical SAM protein [Halanaerobiales bacterium]
MGFIINNPQLWRKKGIDDKLNEEIKTKVDKDGKLELSKEIVDKLNLKPETELRLRNDGDTLMIKRADPLLSRVYIEPTTDCNLNCKTCVRHSWDEKIGRMDLQDYIKIIDDLKEFDNLDRISFWGIGEPLYHPDIVEMIKRAKQLNVNTQIITNGLLLDESMSRNLLKAGLDSLVVSLDGTSPETMADIRSGANLEEIINNVKTFKNLKSKYNDNKTEIGIEFVIMKSNVGELKDLRKLALELGASFIFLTNLLPYTEAMTDEILYSFSNSRSQPEERTEHRPEIYLPPTDLNKDTVNSISKIVGKTSSISTRQVPFDPHNGYCKFVEQGSVAINWKGEVSPCVPLMHSYDCYIRERKKHFKSYDLGNIQDSALEDIYNSGEFKEFRKKLIEFPFSECTQCSGCDMSKTNEKDCHGNTFPVCGDCLWGKGIVQCP